MIELASALTLPITKLLLKSWLGDTGADIGDNLLKLGSKRFGDWAKAGAAQRQANRMAGTVVKDLEMFFTNERVDQNAILPAAFELGETIRCHVDAAFLVNQSLNAEAIAKTLLDARPVEKIYSRVEPEHGLYVRLVEALAPRLRALAPELASFAHERDAAILQKLDEVAHAAPKLLEALNELRERPARLAKSFERDYLDAIVKELDYVEILGIEELDSKSRRADLTVAYLSLTARLGEGEEQQKIDFATVLTLLPLFGNRLWIEGGAGSGKSTLVRWAALEAARWRLGQTRSHDILDIAPDVGSWLNFLEPIRAEYRARGPEVVPHDCPLLDRGDLLRAAAREHPYTDALRDESWRARLPFVAFLRHATQGITLANLPHLVVRTISTPPEGWLQHVFSDAGSNTLLIFDGIDEIPAGRKREQILEQIGDFCERFPNAQILVTSRPGAVEEGTLSGFQKVEIEDLSQPQKLEFIDHWHRALAANFRRAHNDTAIARLHQAALRELEQQPTLALLATNPMLCAAICALHWLSRRKAVEEAWRAPVPSPGSIHGTVLPASLWNLCEQLTRMLVHQRDLDRELGGTALGATYDLSYELKREILARIAYGMVAGDLLSAMVQTDALAHIRTALSSSREQVPADAEDVLQALLERSGVLRGSGKDAIEFIHNTLKAFLAAKFYIGLLTPQEVVRRIASASPKELASGLDEIAVFAASSPDHPAYAQRLIEALLSESSKSAISSKEKRQLQILAVRCEAVAVNLSREMRARVRNVARRLFPPRDRHEARQLATLRDEAVAHLAFRPNAEPSASAAAVHCLRMIGTPAAQDVMRQYLATKSLVVAEELILDHNPLEITAVLTAARGFTWDKISPSIKSAVQNVTPLANLTNLHWLDLSGTQVADAAPLANLTNLISLDLSGTPVADLTPLGDLTNLQWLYLAGTPVAGSLPLANLTKLRLLDLSVTQVSKRDVAELKRALAERGNTSVEIRSS
jgi:NACHT domain/Leucine Rich repeats (2 copies)